MGVRERRIGDRIIFRHLTRKKMQIEMAESDYLFIFAASYPRPSGEGRDTTYRKSDTNALALTFEPRKFKSKSKTSWRWCCGFDIAIPLVCRGALAPSRTPYGYSYINDVGIRLCWFYLERFLGRKGGTCRCRIPRFFVCRRKTL